MPMRRERKQRVVIAAGARTPIGVKCGALSNFSAEDIGVLAAEEVINRSGVQREKIDAVVGANVYQFTAPGAQDVYFPRNIALRCHLETDTPALMVQRICGSGLQTVVTALQQILMPDHMDDTRVVLCVGAETMSSAPQIIRSPRTATNFWEFEEGGSVEDTVLASLNHELASTSMMVTADEYGSRLGVTREACDTFAELSHQRARVAYRASHLNGGDALGGIFALDATDRANRQVHLARDECVRDSTRETLAKLRSITPNGLVSAGNASEIADGAAALLVTDHETAGELGLAARFEVAGYGICGVEPRIMGSGPVPAIRKALERAGVKQTDIGLWEINEAFAAQYLGVEKELDLDRSITNVNGGAIAIGHPLGATGARLLVDLMYEMERRGTRYGCASACIGGGQGIAVVIRDAQMD